MATGPSSAATIGAGAGAFGAAVNDLFSAKGDRIKANFDDQAAEAYRQAAQLASEDATYAEESTAIQEAQAKRAEYKTISGQQADVAASGFGASGSALDLLRDSTQQASLTNAMITTQGAINVAGYQQQAMAYNLEAKAETNSAEIARNAASGSDWAAVISAVAGTAQFASLV